MWPDLYNVSSNLIAFPAINFFSPVNVLAVSRVPQDTKYYLCGCSKGSLGHTGVECSPVPPAHGGAIKGDFTVSIECLVIKLLQLTTLTEVFPCFSSVVRQMPGLSSQSRGTDRISSELLSFLLCLSLCCAIVFMLFCCYYVVPLLCCSVIICVVLCIECMYCTTATGC